MNGTDGIPTVPGQDTHPLSAEGRVRSESMLTLLLVSQHEVVRRRRRRRRLATSSAVALGIGVVLYAASLSWRDREQLPGSARDAVATGASRDGAANTEGGDEAVVPPQASPLDAAPQTPPSMIVVVAADPAIVDRLRATGTGTVRRLDDQSLLKTLGDMGRPTGLVSVGARTTLTVPVTDDIDGGANAARLAPHA